MPGAERIVGLVRTALLTLNDALQTGNFTVLRDVGAPGFREPNSAARLSQIFSNLASQGVDLSGAATTTPELAETPAIDPKTNMLHIKGRFPDQPLQINFELLFQPVAGRWRLFGISVNPTVPAAPAATAASPSAPAIPSDPQSKSTTKQKSP